MNGQCADGRYTYGSFSSVSLTSKTVHQIVSSIQRHSCKLKQHHGTPLIQTTYGLCACMNTTFMRGRQDTFVGLVGYGHKNISHLKLKPFDLRICTPSVIVAACKIFFNYYLHTFSLLKFKVTFFILLGEFCLSNQPTICINQNEIFS